MKQSLPYDLIVLQHQLMMTLSMTDEPSEALRNFSFQAIESLQLTAVYIDRKENLTASINTRSYAFFPNKHEAYKSPLITKYKLAGSPTSCEYLESFIVDGKHWYCFTIKQVGYIAFERTTEFANISKLSKAIVEVLERLSKAYLSRKQYFVNKEQQTKIEVISNSLQAEKRKLEHILGSIKDCILVLDIQGFIYYANLSANKLLAPKSNDMISKHFKEYFRIYDVDTHKDITRVTVDETIMNGEWSSTRPVILRTWEDKELYVRLYVKSMQEGDYDSDTSKQYFVSTFHDMTESHQLEQKLQWQATHDPLTGCLNRHGFSETLEEIVKSRKHPDYLSFISIDLDRFKLINDIGGHNAGDAVLQHVVQLMERDISGLGILARLGGDEFAVIMTNQPNKIVEATAENIRHSIDRLRFKWEENIFTVGASLGIAHICDNETDINEVYIRADEACMTSKENGRNQVTIAPEVIEADDKVIKIHHEFNRNYLHHINRALVGSDSDYELVLYKQSIRSLSSDSIDDHHEILLRLSYKSTIIPPDTFLPAAERSGIVREIDLFVLEKTLLHIKKEQDGHYNINLSGVSLSDDITRQKIFNLISKYPIQAQSICLEVTETSAITNLTKCIVFMEKLNQLGVSFALDDFGTGVSSFSYLKSLPVKYLKIDGSFIRDICHNKIDEIVVQSIVSASNAMHIHTVAEYVSDEAILNKVTSLGIDYAQGYWMGLPTRLN